MTNPWKTLRCPHCRMPYHSNNNSAIIPPVLGSSFILSCDCGEIPVVDGILYTKKDDRAAEALAHIRRGNYSKAMFALTDHYFPVRLLLLLGLRLRTVVPFFPFSSLLVVLQSVGYDAGWARYLIERTKLPTYRLSQYSLSWVKDAQVVLDIGCGAGQLLGELSRVKSSSFFLGLDRSFINLLFARYFFVTKETVLLCGDYEKSLPCTTESISTILINDTLQYVPRLAPFFDEVARVLKPNGVCCCFHILNRGIPVSFGTGVSAEKLRGLLIQRKFFPLFFTNQTLWEHLLSHTGITPEDEDTKLALTLTYGFNVVMKKGSAPSLFKALPYFSRKKCNFRQDAELLGSSQFSYVTRAKHHIFISPHYDDAILSAGFLMKKLRKEGKSVHLLTIFTRASSKPYSPQAKDFLSLCNEQDAGRLFQIRQKENDRIVRKMRIYSLDFTYTDAAWRTYSSFLKNRMFVYPDAPSQFSGFVSVHDDGVRQSLSRELSSFLQNFASNSSVIYVPLGIGGHADHVLCREIVESIVSHPVFWKDLPYSNQQEAATDFFMQNPSFTRLFQLPAERDKEGLIRLYASQIPSLFPSGDIPNPNEEFFIR